MNFKRIPLARRGLGMIAALALIVGMTAVSAAGAQQEELSVLVPAEFSDLDPCEIISGDQIMIKYHVFSRLYTFNEDMEPMPDLVQSDEVSEDGLTWTFELRPGMTFHDGTPVDSEAVKYTIERMRENECGQRALFAMVDEIIIEDETTFSFVTDGAFPSLRNNFAHPDSAIISPTADQELGDDFGLRPVGSGPYVFDEWVTGDRITLVRNEDYYGEQPFFDRLRFNFIPDSTTRGLMIDTGQADVALRTSPADTQRLRNNPNLDVLDVTARNMYFALNLAREPFDDHRVRLAANYAVDKEAIIDRILEGTGTPAQSLVEAVQHTIEAGFYEYDPERARELLEEAGAVGAEVLMLAPSGRYAQDIEVSQAVAGYLRDVGFDVDIRAMSDWPSYVDAVGEGDFDMYLLGWGGSTGDPDNAFRRIIYGEIAGEYWNSGSYANPEVDRLIEEGSAIFDEERRADIYAEIQRMVWDDAPWIFLYRATTFVVHDAAIDGIVVLPGIEMPYYWLAQRQ